MVAFGDKEEAIGAPSKPPLPAWRPPIHHLWSQEPVAKRPVAKL